MGRVVVASGVSWTTGSQIAAQGDSGGPVIAWTGGGKMTLYGILSGAGIGFTDGITSIPPDYVFSTLPSISSDLWAFNVY
mgnify:CR=1 FL=1